MGGAGYSPSDPPISPIGIFLKKWLDHPLPPYGFSFFAVKSCLKSGCTPNLPPPPINVFSKFSPTEVKSELGGI